MLNTFEKTITHQGTLSRERLKTTKQQSINGRLSERTFKPFKIGTTLEVINLEDVADPRYALSL